ncbi:MAG: hypothetical protein ACOCXJ_01520 [Planctomycetota bacterium]
MIIGAASVQALSAASSSRQRRVSEQLEIRVTDQAGQVAASTAQAPAHELEKPELNQEQRQILEILERVFGATIRSVAAPSHASVDAPEQGRAPARSPATPGFAVRYHRSEELRETQRLQLAFTGHISTVDGRKLTIDLRQVQEQMRIERRDLTLSMGDPALIDPLVLDLDGDGVSLTDARMRLDLDADGQLDDIARIESSDAFLVLDRDDDQQLDDGRELFGPTSGDGYGELARLDDDGNGFIDAGDSAWSRLHLGRVDTTGTVHLQSVQEAGIGALSLQHVASPFAHYQDDRLQGLSRSSGFYLREDGSAGLVSQVDFVA